MAVNDVPSDRLRASNNKGASTFLDIPNVIIIREGGRKVRRQERRRGELGACLDLVITRHGSREMRERLDETRRELDENRRQPRRGRGGRKGRDG